MKFGLVEGIRRLVQLIFGMGLFEMPILRNLRMWAYMIVFDIKKPAYISNHVVMFRGHSNVGEFDDDTQSGVLSIGEHVGISAGVEIDYCGNVEMGKYVWISEGAKIFSHTHEMVPDRVYHTKSSMKPTRLYVGDYAWLGANVLVLPNVSYVGKNAIIGAGSVVTKDIPDNAVAVGNPAKVIRYLTDEELVTAD